MVLLNFANDSDIDEASLEKAPNPVRNNKNAYTPTWSAMLKGGTYDNVKNDNSHGNAYLRDSGYQHMDIPIIRTDRDEIPSLHTNTPPTSGPTVPSPPLKHPPVYLKDGANPAILTLIKEANIPIFSAEGSTSPEQPTTYNVDIRLGSFSPIRYKWEGEQRKGISMRVDDATSIEDHPVKQ